jgi:ribosomal protein S18 acetylase RimI-like enzyme
MKHNNYEIEYRSPTVSEYTTLRDLAGWWKVEDESVESALKNSLFSVVAIKDNIILGFGRIIGDGGLYFYIQDLIVDPKYRNKGIGKALMRELMNFIDANARSGAVVGLMAAKGLEKYYESFGFQARDSDAPGMYKIIRKED